MTGIHNHYWCFLPNVYEAPPETEEINIIFTDQDGYNTYSDCSGCKNYDQTPLLFVAGSSGASTKAPIDGYTFDHLDKLHVVDSQESGERFSVGNQPRMNLGKASKMGRKLDYWKGVSYEYVDGEHPNKDHKTFDGGPVDIPPPAKRAGLYNPLNYGNLFNWLYYKYHEGVYCTLPDGRTYDNEVGSYLTKMENWDRGNIAYGKERLYYTDMYPDWELIDDPFKKKVNARPHTLILQLDPRNIWNTHRLTMALGKNASRQYGEYPNKKTYYNGMGGVVGGTDTLSPITYAYANRSDYQKEAGTNFLPCCSRTDGSMSSTCPYPVHDKNFNFEEPVGRYDLLKNYIPGRASFGGTVTISRGGLLSPDSQNNDPTNTDYRGDVRNSMSQYYEHEEVPDDDGETLQKIKDKVTSPIFTSGWKLQDNSEVYEGTVDSPRSYTEKEFLESTANTLVKSFWHKWVVGGNYSVYDAWARGGVQGPPGDPKGHGIFRESMHYNAIGMPLGIMSAYGYIYNGDDNPWGSDSGLYGYTIQTTINNAAGEATGGIEDYYYNSTYIEYEPGGTKYNGGAVELTNIPIYGYRYVQDSPIPDACRGYFCEGAPGYQLFNAVFFGCTGAEDVPPEDLAHLPDCDNEEEGLDYDELAQHYSDILEKSALTYYDPAGLSGPDVEPLWRFMMSNHGHTSDAYVTGRTKFKKEIDLYERHPADNQIFKRLGYYVGGESPPAWEWDVPGDPPTIPDFGHDAVGNCMTMGDALFDEDGMNINGGDPYNISIGTCCWFDDRSESEYFGHNFCFDPWFLNLGSRDVEAWTNFYTDDGFYDPRDAGTVFFAKPTCDCINARANVTATWHPLTTCMLNDGSVDDAFPSYYEDYLGVPRGYISPGIGFHNPFSTAMHGIDPDDLALIYTPSPCGGQYKVWPCLDRGPKWWPQYLMYHYPGEQPVYWVPHTFGSEVEPHPEHRVAHGPEGANTWPDPRIRGLFKQFNLQNLDMEYDLATMYCLKVPEGYGLPGGPVPGDTGPYWIEVTAGDYPWTDCNWPWSRHTYDAAEFPCPDSDGGPGPPGGSSIGFYPTNPAEQNAWLSSAGYEPGGDRRDLLQALDDRCEGFLAHYDANKPTPHDGPGTGNWYQGMYISQGSGHQAPGPGGDAALANPTPPGLGLGNYSPYPSINAGHLGDVGFQTTPKRRIRFTSWARWREWMPWTNFAPVIMNHIERWIMPGRVSNLKKINIHLPKGTHAFGSDGGINERGMGPNAGADRYSWYRGDLYFPRFVTDYSFPMRGLNHGCTPDPMSATGETGDSPQDATYTGTPYYHDHVPGHLSLNDERFDPNFPLGFDLSGTRKTLNKILRDINPEIEIEWILYPERDISSQYFNGVSFRRNEGTANNNAGIFLGEIIYQTCAYNYYENDFGDKVWYYNQKECLDFLDPTRICTDYYDFLYPNGYPAFVNNPFGIVDGVANHGPSHWNTAGDPYGIAGQYGIWITNPDGGTGGNVKPGWRGCDFFNKHMQIGHDDWRPDYMHDDLLQWLRDFDIWADDDKTTLDTPVMREYYWLMNSGESSSGAIDPERVALMPCRFSGYRPSMQRLNEKLEELHPDLFTAAWDLDPFLRPLKTFNTQKHLVGYYDVINKETELIDAITGESKGTVKEKYIEATGPPPFDIRYANGPGGASAGTDGELCWGSDCRPPANLFSGSISTGIPVDGLGGEGNVGHDDWGWGRIGGGLTASTSPADGSADLDLLTFVDIIDWWFHAAFYNENGERDAALAEAVEQGWSPNKLVWSNNCPGLYEDGNFGGWSCDGNSEHVPNPEWDIGCDNSPSGGDGACYADYGQTTACCGFGLWDFHDESMCGVDENDEPIGCRELIAAGPSHGGGYVLTNRFPSFWDTLSYPCNSFGVGIMHWALQKSRSTVYYDDPWWQNFMIPVLEIIWYGIYHLDREDSPWLVSNGGCFPYEAGELQERWLDDAGEDDTYSWATQPRYSNVMRNCTPNSSFRAMVAGGLMCRPDDWNLIPHTNSTLWQPDWMEVTGRGGIDVMKKYDIGYPERLHIRNVIGRQTLPSGMEAITLRDKGNIGGSTYGFGYLQTTLDENNLELDMSNELSGLYGPSKVLSPDEIAEMAEDEADLYYELGVDYISERDIDRCGPIDAPYPCISRFVRPNTDITLTDRYGYTMEGYHPLQTSKNGVGRPIEMGNNFSGDGTLPSHGYGNTFDFRFGYKVPPAGEDYNSFDELSTRLQRVHHSGKQVRPW